MEKLINLSSFTFSVCERHGYCVIERFLCKETETMWLNKTGYWALLSYSQNFYLFFFFEQSLVVNYSLFPFFFSFSMLIIINVGLSTTLGFNYCNCCCFNYDTQFLFSLRFLSIFFEILTWMLFTFCGFWTGRVFFRVCGEKTGRMAFPFPFPFPFPCGLFIQGSSNRHFLFLVAFLLLFLSFDSVSSDDGKCVLLRV